MIPEIGQFALILALGLATLQTVLPLYGVWRSRADCLAVAAPAAIGQFVMMGIAFVALGFAFYANDFSVAYVAANSNTQLPWFYRLAAIWGAHEGSLLLWMTLLACWSLAVALASRTLPREVASCVLAVMGAVSVGFLLFTLFTSNPFERQFPAPVEGRDLNPLLQDPGLVVHPPMLYMGYVGFAVAFAFAITALITGRVDSAWTRWTRPWTTAAWVFLTIGVTLGSWWAYNELGWGGWWFWDPVENASFMPWLVGTALIHSLAVTEKRGIFKSWTVLLAITAFALSLLGTFLVRSGVLISVHAFATDPTRGIYILTFFAVVVGGSLLLYALRAAQFESGREPVAALSREGLLLLNNIFLVVAAAGVLLGTLYPILADSLGMGRISVGPPYFNKVFIPLTAPLVVLIGAAAVMAWKRTRADVLRSRLWAPLLISIAVGVALPLLTVGTGALVAVAGCVLGCWAIATAFEDIVRRSRGRRVMLPRNVVGMALSHAGVGIFVIGVSLVSGFGSEHDVRLAPGESTEMVGYDFTFVGTRHVDGPNFTAEIGDFIVRKDGEQIAELYPAKRRYNAAGQTMTESGIDIGFTRDLYVSLGEPLSGDAWSVRIYHRPFVRWIWAGGFIAALGGLIALSDKRYYRRRATADKAVAVDRGLNPATA
ncbi:Cytochrome c-type biosis protein CcmF [Salinisphaera shabanensis E1L3A]|uniref:Cytochrome c-type biosis protein CcmF n=1 Tax=Salinisphaera shabanensis E1L3A TaxID=1033802 RepID=F7QCJ5_9GAMM|nr:heme lyase CcmF/NrfE family subunit [Salinisphaera shabanensis]ERJ18511.1 Cytochrome c-type biosis protein CcmF [Salinisphaera shabanensis E1L3A]